jgi:predicted transcriptional regulator
MDKKIYSSKTDFVPMEIRRDLADRIKEIANETDNKKRKITNDALEAGLAIVKFN